MPFTRRRFMLGSLGSAFAPQLFSMTSSLAPDAAGTKPYGSGHFGEWIVDECGLPAFRYTCDQTTDPKARTEVSAGNVLEATEHIHQVGNDRITALASNYGHVRVRQDEGAPKFLNDYDPESAQYAGGIGWLTDGHESLSTFYSGQHPAFERIFGVGYFRKKVSSANYAVDQIIFAPFGDDPVLLSQVTITNRSAAPASLRWIEYWGCQTHEFTLRAFIESWAGMGTPPQICRRLGQRYAHRVEPVQRNRGLLESRQFLGHSPQDDAVWQKMRESLSAHPNNFISAIPDPKAGTWFDGGPVPQTFLVSLDELASAFSTNAAAFFGSAGPANPAGLAQPLDGNLGSTDQHTALLLERAFHLAPGQSRTLHFLYGYLPTGYDLQQLIARYEPHASEGSEPVALKGHGLEPALSEPEASRMGAERPPEGQEALAPEGSSTALAASCAAWKRTAPHFAVASEPWVERETTWNHYCLRSSLTFDDYFGQHILNQNGYYQYVMGFQGAARDPLQHALPFLFTDPAIVRSVLRYTLSEVREDGSLPYGLTGYGVVAPMVSDKASDLPLWLLWAVSEYVLAARDTDFLREQIPARVTGSGSDTVANLLARCYRHQVNDVGTGQHGICRMLADDWNDGLLGTWAASNFAEAEAQGESVLNSAMSAWVFDDYAHMLRFAGLSPDLQEQLRNSAAKHRDAVRAQWTSRWFRRCWLGEKLGWLGEETLWIEPQPWALLAGATTPDQSRTLIASINELLRRGPIGAAQMSQQGPDISQPGLFDQGTVVRGGIWPSLNQTLIWSLAGIDPAMAWDEWKKNSFAAHAEAYPDMWYGTWSGSDSYNAPFSKTPGATGGPGFHGTDFPVLNLHSHACFLYSATKLLGINFDEHGLELRPALPAGPYRFESPLIGLASSREAHYEGWYAPLRPGTWTVRIHLPAAIAQRITHATVNGAAAPLHRAADGTMTLSGLSEPAKPLRWTLSAS